MSSPFFTIVIPTFNRALTVGTAIRSVLAQTERDFELVIVDDGSTDNTREIVSSFLDDSRIRYVFQKNSERGAARNCGYRIANGRYLNFFDSDDIMLPWHLEKARDFISKYTYAKFFHTCYEVADEHGAIVLRQLGVPETRAARQLIRTNYLACNSVFIERELFGKNLFNEDRELASSEDWELWLRIISRVSLLRCEHVTFRILEHSSRSLNTISPESIVKRDSKLLRYLLADIPFTVKFSHYLSIFEADRYTYFSLLFTSRKDGRRQAFYYWRRALQATPLVLFRRRFWASMKHIVLGIFIAK